MNSGIRNERFIISAENRSYREIFNWMAHGFGKTTLKKSRPVFSRVGMETGKNEICSQEKETPDNARIGYNSKTAECLQQSQTIKGPSLVPFPVPGRFHL
jgi:hypothetical protein